MKTLDEVIKAIAWCAEHDRCGACPYSDNADNRCYEEDALHYLKEYKNTDENYKRAIAHVTEVIDHYEKMVADYLAVNNPPLIWDELKQMEGKPVWIEFEKNGNHWLIITDIKSNGAVGRGVYGENVPLYKDRIGTDWKAYRKERV